ncbi:hypothetical protein BKA61DRAFT_625227 [Leptodontidium sp. MPI-SDFR-AT-0119]|nr:hypothetical protein BKA61DRAFT_625227 [Leptodontidium sp. MPI-SDFR-AT-0119]
MDPPLFRCGDLTCAAKGALPIDRFGVKKDGTRVQMCLSCSVRHRAYGAAYRNRQRASNTPPESQPALSYIYSEPTARRHHFQDFRSNERAGPPALPSVFNPFLNSIGQIRPLGHGGLPLPTIFPSSTRTGNGYVEPSTAVGADKRSYQHENALLATSPHTLQKVDRSEISETRLETSVSHQSSVFNAFRDYIPPSSTIPPNKRRHSYRDPAPARPLKIRTRTKTELDKPPHEAVRVALHFLEDEFNRQEAASEVFPPKISSSHIRTSVSKYEGEMLTASKTSVCCSCGKLVPTADVYGISNEDNFIRPLQGCLDICGRHGNIWDFCWQCHTALSLNAIPKFSAKNLLNVTMCQHYPKSH